MTAATDLVHAHEIVSAVPGLSYRMLDYWTRCGHIKPAVEAQGSGTRRLFHASTIPFLTRAMAAHRYLGATSNDSIPIKALGRVADLLDVLAAADITLPEPDQIGMLPCGCNVNDPDACRHALREVS